MNKIQALGIANCIAGAVVCVVSAPFLKVFPPLPCDWIGCHTPVEVILHEAFGALHLHFPNARLAINLLAAALPKMMEFIVATHIRKV